ncbi:MAG: AbrB/MazE/SpoVT family DNA-binding domain-containing protein [Cetobacterium sp.]
MIKRICKQGQSHMILLPKKFLDFLNIDNYVKIELINDKIVITKTTDEELKKNGF